MRQSFLQQLSQYENALITRGIGPKTSRWTELYINPNEQYQIPHVENEELILRNTFLNSQMAPLADLSNMRLDEPRSFKLVWADFSQHNKPLAEEDLD